LLEELAAALADKTLSARVRFYRSFDLLIIDEFGFDKLERSEYPESPSLLYKVIDARNGRGSTALVTNVDFGDWTDYLGDPPLVMAILDRVSDRTIIQKFTGKSYRKFRTEQMQREQATRAGAKDRTTSRSKEQTPSSRSKEPSPSENRSRS
jgi:DNA replication protein DnaC